LALKVSAIPQSILRLKTIVDTVTDTEKVLAIPLIPILYHDINNPGYDYFRFAGSHHGFHQDAASV
jgi:hypothetical protein